MKVYVRESAFFPAQKGKIFFLWPNVSRRRIGLFEVVRVKKKINPVRFWAEKLLLPAELIPNVPRTTIHGNSYVCIENHGGIKTYTKSRIEVKIKDGVLRVEGDGLELGAMTPEEIVITGMVVSVEFC